MDHLSFETHGVAIRIRVNDLAVMQPIREQLPPGWQTTARDVDRTFSVVRKGPDEVVGTAETYELYRDEEKILIALDTGLLLWTLESEIEMCLAEMAPARIFVHAGVVGWKGRAILLPGPSYCGKTTLTAALVRAGATYYSDEYAVLDERGLVHPYARPLSHRDEEAGLARKVSVESLGGSAGTIPLAVGLVAIATYQPGAVWEPRRVTPGAAMLVLLQNTLSARHAPERSLEALQQVAESAVVVQGERGDAERVAVELLAVATGRCV